LSNFFQGWALRLNCLRAGCQAHGPFVRLIHAVLPAAASVDAAPAALIYRARRLLECKSLIYGWLLPSVRTSTQWLLFQRS
jgi:hypothetical protein